MINPLGKLSNYEELHDVQLPSDEHVHEGELVVSERPVTPPRSMHYTNGNNGVIAGGSSSKRVRVRQSSVQHALLGSNDLQDVMGQDTPREEEATTPAGVVVGGRLLSSHSIWLIIQQPTTHSNAWGAPCHCWLAACILCSHILCNHCIFVCRSKLVGTNHDWYVGVCVYTCMYVLFHCVHSLGSIIHPHYPTNTPQTYPNPIPQNTAIADDFGFDDKQKDLYLGAYISGAFFAVGAPAALLVGYLSDRANRKWLMCALVLLGMCVVVGDGFT